jgi:hypothetical protein
MPKRRAIAQATINRKGKEEDRKKGRMLEASNEGKGDLK